MPRLAGLEVDNGELVAPGGRYRLVVVPAVERMSPEHAREAARAAAPWCGVVFESLPQRRAGLRAARRRRAELAQLLADPALRAAVPAQGIEPRLAELAVRREGAGPAGLGFIRRAQPEGFDYFFTNLSARDFDGWLDLGVSARLVTSP